MEVKTNELHETIMQGQAQRSNLNLKNTQLTEQNQNLIREIANMGLVNKTDKKESKEDYELACIAMRAFCG